MSTLLFNVLTVRPRRENFQLFLTVKSYYLCAFTGAQSEWLELLLASLATDLDNWTTLHKVVWLWKCPRPVRFLKVPFSSFLQPWMFGLTMSLWSCKKQTSTFNMSKASNCTDTFIPWNLFLKQKKKNATWLSLHTHPAIQEHLYPDQRDVRSKQKRKEPFSNRKERKKQQPAEQSFSQLMLALIYKRYTGAMPFAAPTWNFLVPNFGNSLTGLQGRIQFGRAYYCYCACAELNALLLTEAPGELSRGVRTPPSVCQENCDFLRLLR